MVEKYKRAMRSLWSGRCDISVKEDFYDITSGRTKQRDRILFSDVPCRISYKMIDVTAEESYASRKTQKTVLIISSEVQIPEGSKITVTQAGATETYERSGTSAVYSYHQEVPIIIKKDWA